MTTPKSVTNNGTVRFPSFESLHSAHTELLKEFRIEGINPELKSKIETFIRHGTATGALLEKEDERWAAQSQLDYWATQLYRPDYEPPDATLEEFDRELELKIEDKDCPYLGLDAFQETNHDVFFGREHLMAESVDKLQSLRFLAIVGASGSGKSSLVRAGLIPRLKKGALPGSANWKYLTPIVPGSKPLSNLAHLFLSYESDSTDLEQEVIRYQEDSSYLAKVVSKRLKNNVILVVDQFEEIFTLCTDEKARQQFVQNLISLCEIPDAEHRVIITLRSDFEPNIVRLPQLQLLFEHATVRITPLTASELREAIEAPAARIGLKFEDGVVDALLSDTLGEPAALPLLQFTLLKLWEKRERSRITWMAYKKLGGGREALARSADELFSQMIHEDQVTMRRILLKMVRPTEGLEMTSSRIPVALLYQKGEALDRIQHVVHKLIEYHLVRISPGDTADDDQVEVAHEALIRNWPRLVEWLDDERVAMRQRHRLTLATEEWEQLGRVISVLWEGERLEQTRGYDDLTALENEFIIASYEAEHIREEKEIRTRIWGWIAIAVSVGVVLAGAVLLLSIPYFDKRASESQAIAETQAVTLQEQSAIINRISATSTSLSATAVSAETLPDRIIRANALAQQAQSITANGGSDRMVAILLAIHSMRLFPTIAAKEVIQDSLLAYPLLRLDHDDAVLSIAFSSTGQYALTRTSKYIRIWDTNTGVQTAHTESDKFLSSAAFSPNTRFIVAGACAEANGFLCTTGIVETIDVTTGKEIWKMNHGNIVLAVAVSPDSKYVVSTGCDQLQNDGICTNGSARVWDALTGQEFARMIHEGTVESVSFSPDSKYIVSGSSDRTARVWDAITGQELARMMHEDAVESVAFSPDGKYIVSGSSDKTARVWDAITGQELARMMHEDAVESVAFSPDGKYIVSGSLDKTARVWDTVTSQEIARTQHSGYVFSVAFSPDGKYVISGSNTKTARVWEALTGKESAQMIHDGNVTAVALNPDGKRGISASEDGIVYIWLYRATDISQIMVDTCALATRNLTLSEWKQYVGNQPYEAICPSLPPGSESTSTP